MTTSYIRLTVSSFDQHVLDGAIQNMIDVFKQLGTDVVGPIPNPTTSHRYKNKGNTNVVFSRYLDVAPQKTANGDNPNTSWEKIITGLQKCCITNSVAILMKSIEY